MSVDALSLLLYVIAYKIHQKLLLLYQQTLCSALIIVLKKILAVCIVKPKGSKLYSINYCSTINILKVVESIQTKSSIVLITICKVKFEVLEIYIKINPEWIVTLYFAAPSKNLQ